MLSSVTAEQLLELAEELDSADARDLAAAIVTFGVEPEAWSRLEPRVVPLLEQSEPMPDRWHEDEVGGRLWAAIEIAKAGAPSALLEALDRLPDDPPMFMWGDPWTAYDLLRRAAPVPPEVDELLASRWSGDLDRNQRLVIAALTGRWDAEGTPTGSGAGTEPPVGVQPERPAIADLDPWDLSVVTDLLRHQGTPVLLGDLGSLDPRTAGRLLADLVVRTMAEEPQGRMLWGNRTMRVLGAVRTAELPVHDLVVRFAESGGAMPASQLGAVLARDDDDEVATVVLHVARSAAPDVRRDLTGLLRATAISAATGATPMLGAGPGPAPVAPAPVAPAAATPAPAGLQPAPAPAPAPQVSIGAPDAAAPRKRLWSRLRPAARRSSPRPDEQRSLDETRAGAEADETAAGAEAAAGDEAPLPTTAYPRLDAPGKVVARTPFEVTIGLAPDSDQRVGTTGKVPLAELAAGREKLDLEVELVVDPRSLRLDLTSAHPMRVELAVTGAHPYPTAAVRLVAETAPDLFRERTLRLILRVDGRVVGLAKRQLVVVDDAAEMATTPDPRPPGRDLLNLRPLLREDAPDLVVGVYRSDETADTWVWDVYPLGSTLRLADDERVVRIDGTARDYAAYVRRGVSAAAATSVGTYRNLTGYGRLVAQTIPRAVRQVLTDLMTGRSTAPSVLLLTEEAFVPWELAAPRDPALVSSWGGDSPFLGAHLAISRWPCDQDGPPPGPPVSLAVPRRAVVTADYEGLAAELPHARAEAERLAQTYAPMETLEPTRTCLEAVLEGRTPVDLLHVALHGQFDQGAQEDGLVLLRPDDAGGRQRDFLTGLGVAGLAPNRAATPFVFLNACQVGSADEVLGSYAGLAVAVLRTGASGVVAPLWNIDDVVAAALADRFYAETLGGDRVAVAEVLRRIRAEYTLAAVEADPPAVTATYLAYQFFGHPCFRLRLDADPPTPSPVPDPEEPGDA